MLERAYTPYFLVAYVVSNFEKSISFFGDVDVGGGGLEANEAAGQLLRGGAFGTRSLRGDTP